MTSGYAGGAPPGQPVMATMYAPGQMPTPGMYGQYPQGYTQAIPGVQYYAAPPVGYSGPTGGSNIWTTSDNFTRDGFSDKSVRNQFIGKVYMILTAQLAVTGAFITLCMFIGVFFVTYFTLVCIPQVRRRSPGNFIALSVFTLAFTYLAAAITCSYKTHSVLVAVIITGTTCLLVSLFAIYSCLDFTKCTGLLMVLSIAFLLFGIACMIVYFVLGPNRILSTVYGGVAAALFILYLAFDTQMIIGGRSHEISPEEYIYGALQLYMDVMNLFLIFLHLTGDQN